MTTGAGGREAGAGAFADQIAFELSQCAKQVKHESTTIDAVSILLHASQADAGGVKPLDQVDQIFQRATQPVWFGSLFICKLVARRQHGRVSHGA